MCLRKCSLSQHAKFPFANNRRKLAGPGDSIDFDEFAKVMRKMGCHIALDVDTGGCVLHEKVGRGNVVRNDAANAHRITTCRVFGAELADLVRAGEERQRLEGWLRR